MNVAMILLITVGVLFAVVFLTRRRFGLLGLALAAGSILSDLWSRDLTPLIKDVGVEIAAPPLVTVVAAALVLLPAAALFFRGPANKHLPQRLLSAAAFALLALAFLLPVFGEALVLEGDGQVVYDFVSTYRSWIITVGIGYALFDLLMVRGHGGHGKEH